MSLTGILETVGKLGTVIHHQRKMTELVCKTRKDGVAEIYGLVDALPQQKLLEFEEHFLNASIILTNPAHRIRAMELYVYLKLFQANKYGDFSEFRYSGAALA
jgi:hypothetical protein